MPSPMGTFPLPGALLIMALICISNVRESLNSDDSRCFIFDFGIGFGAGVQYQRWGELLCRCGSSSYDCSCGEVLVERSQKLSSSTCAAESSPPPRLQDKEQRWSNCGN